MEKLKSADSEYCSSKLKLQTMYNDMSPQTQAKYSLTEGERETTSINERLDKKNLVEYMKADAYFKDSIQDLYSKFGVGSYHEFRDLPLPTQTKDSIEARLKELSDKSKTLEALAKKDFAKIISTTPSSKIASMIASFDSGSSSSSSSSSVFKK